MTPQDKQSVDELIATYLEGLHNPSDDQLYNELRAKRDTEYLKAQLSQLLIKERIDERKMQGDEFNSENYRKLRLAHLQSQLKEMEE